jgi:DNA-binding NtrC family response regulator
MMQVIRRIIDEHKRDSGDGTPGAPIAHKNREGMVGSCPEMLQLFSRITKVAPTDTNVLVEGESGTGKELVARALHEGSSRRGRKMISLNCAAIPDTLIESELFGHERGAFTGATNSRKGLVEAADHSSLFLDEIGELPLDAQARLLRVIQEGEVRRVGSVETIQVDVRLITATHRNLRKLIKTGGFREDLYYRLNVVKLALPPLRDRGDDIEELARAILSQTCTNLGTGLLTFTDAAMSSMRSYRWPGNIRELENAIERAVILCDEEEIDIDLLSIDLDPSEMPIQTINPEERNGSSLDDYVHRFVLENQDQMTETDLAEKLGISRKNLWERRKKLKIPRVKSKRR